MAVISCRHQFRLLLLLCVLSLAVPPTDWHGKPRWDSSAASCQCWSRKTSSSYQWRAPAVLGLLWPWHHSFASAALICRDVEPIPRSPRCRATVSAAAAAAASMSVLPQILYLHLTEKGKKWRHDAATQHNMATQDCAEHMSHVVNYQLHTTPLSSRSFRELYCAPQSQPGHHVNQMMPPPTVLWISNAQADLITCLPLPMDAVHPTSSSIKSRSPVMFTPSV